MVGNFVERWYQIELEWIKSIDQFRTPFLDQFFIGLDFFDTKVFYILLVTIVWIGIHWRWGLRLLAILITNALMNELLKRVFQEPRPLNLDPSVGLIEVSGYGFPSGTAQSVMLLTGIALIYIKSPWKWVIAATYFPLVSFSRIYLGVHFLSDILGGWLVGGLLLLLFVYLFPPLERKLEKTPFLYLFIFCELVGLLLYKTHYGAFIICLGVGLAITYYFQSFLPHVKNFRLFFLRSLVGLIGIGLCLVIFKTNSIWFSIVASLWISCGSQLTLSALK